MSDVLVVGGSGLVGTHLLRAAVARGMDAVGTCYEHASPELESLDVRIRSDVEELVGSVHPHLVLVAAASANVDWVEAHPAEASAVNVAGLRNIVDSANAVHASVVYFSSDYVFDGHEGPYEESARPNPLSQYGRQKLLAEEVVAGAAKPWLILRTTVVYGWEPRGKNFVASLLSNLREGEHQRVPSDQIGTPTYAPDLADAALDLVATGVCGLYHVAGPDLVDRYGFALAVADAFGLDASLVEPVSTRELHQAAIRPLRAGLISAKAERVIQRRLPGYREGLVQMANADAGVSA